MQSKLYDVVILAGGKGSRIKKFSKFKPKPLINIGKINFLQILIQNLSKFNIRKIFIMAGYKGNQIKKKFHKKKINCVDIECIVEKKTLGTGGCLRLIKNKVSNKFFIVNGDTFFDINLDQIYKNKILDHQFYICLTKNKNYKSNKQLILLGLKNKKIFFKNSSTLINGGTYLLNKKTLKKFSNKKFSLESFLNKEIKKGNCFGNYYNEYFIDIGTPKNLKLAQSELVNYLKKPALFLDRDKTLIEDNGYTYKIKDLRFIKKTLRFIKKFKNFYFFIVTNQSGIARGYFTENDFFKFQLHLKQKLIHKKIYIDYLIFCPFLRDAKINKYRKNSSYRKPGNSMIKFLEKAFFINKKKSIMIGNSLSDERCAKRSKLRFINIQDI